MSFNRLNYDDGAYKHLLRESVGPGEYAIARPRNDCDGCFFTSPYIRGTHGGAICPERMTDVDSELLGLTRKNSKCPANQYIPGAAANTAGCVPKMPKDCVELTPEETRLSNPPCTLRGTGWNRWEWLCTNPQDKALMPFDIQINNRLLVKDNHRPCVPRPLSQEVALPPAENDAICYDWSSRYTQPMVDVVSPQLGVCESLRRL